MGYSGMGDSLMEFKQFQETEMQYQVKRGNGVDVSSSLSKYNGSSILIATGLSQSD